MFEYLSSMDTEISLENTVAPTTVPALERRSTTTKNRVQCKQDLIITWLQEFYSRPGNMEKLLPIIKGESPMSLRLIDYFATNYAKKMNTSFILGGKQFLVYYNYKRELNAYSKRLFDPFCRRERIQFEARGHESFVTTVGQLNFFRWAIEKDILAHIDENREAIERDMNSTLRDHYSRSTTAKTQSTLATVQTTTVSVSATTVSTGSSRKKRSELTQSAMKKVNYHACDVVLSFS